MALPTLPDNVRSTDAADALRQAAVEAVELRNRRSSGEFNDDDARELRSRIDFINDVDPIQRALAAAEEVTRSTESQGPTAALDTVENRVRSIGEQVVANDKYKSVDYNATFGAFEVRGSMHHQRTLITTADDDTPAAGHWLPLGQPIPPAPRQQRLFVRDLMSQINTTLNAIPYILESDPVTSEAGASAVAEGVAKPEVSMEFAMQTANVTKIAAWVPATSEIIEDAPLLRGYIDTRLAYMLALREEQQLLYGAGTGAQLKGVLSWTSGDFQNQTQASVTDDLSAGVGQAIAKIENVDGEADGAVFNALDFWAAVVTRHTTQFDNGFGGNAPAILSGITWGLPAIRSRSVTQGTYAVGAFRLGATIADRADTVIRVGNQHASYFVENKVAILAEERLALLCHRPDLFVNGDV